MTIAINNDSGRGTVEPHGMSIPKELAKASPPIAVASFEAIANIPVGQWIQYATLTYVTLQIVFLVYDRLIKPRLGPKQ